MALTTDQLAFYLNMAFALDGVNPGTNAAQTSALVPVVGAIHPSIGLQAANFAWTTASGWNGDGGATTPYAVHFDGGNDRGFDTNVDWSSLTPQLDSTLEIWFKPDGGGSGTYEKVFTYYIDASNWLNIEWYTTSGYLYITMEIAGTTYQSRIIGLTSGNLYMATMTFAATTGTRTGYLNGSAATIQNASSTPGTSAGINIGSRQPNSDRFFGGDLCSVRYYKKALSSGEIADNYAAGVNASIGTPATIALTPSTLTFSSPQPIIQSNITIALTPSTLTFSSPQSTLNAGHELSLSPSTFSFSSPLIIVHSSTTAYDSDSLQLFYHASRANSALYPGDNTTPVTMWDSVVPVSYPLTLSNFAWTTSSGWSGDGSEATPNCLVFDGVNDIAVNTNINSSLLAITPMSFEVEFFINTLQTTQYQLIVGYQSDVHNKWGLIYDLTNQRVYEILLSAGTGWGTYIANVTPSAWHSVIVSASSIDNTKTYLDGVSVTRNSGSSGLTLANGLQVGGISAGNKLSGNVNLIRFYNKAVDQTTVTMNVTNGKAWQATGFNLTPSTLTFSSPHPTLEQGHILNLTPSTLTFNAPNLGVVRDLSINLTPSTLTFSSPSPVIEIGIYTALSPSTLTFSSPQPTIELGQTLSLTTSTLTFSSPNVTVTTSGTTSGLDYSTIEGVNYSLMVAYHNSVGINFATSYYKNLLDFHCDYTSKASTLTSGDFLRVNQCITGSNTLNGTSNPTFASLTALQTYEHTIKQGGWVRSAVSADLMTRPKPISSRNQTQGLTGKSTTELAFLAQCDYVVANDSSDQSASTSGYLDRHIALYNLCKTYPGGTTKIDPNSGLQIGQTNFGLHWMPYIKGESTQGNTLPEWTYVSSLSHGWVQDTSGNICSYNSSGYTSDTRRMLNHKNLNTRTYHSNSMINTVKTGNFSGMFSDNFLTTTSLFTIKPNLWEAQAPITFNSSGGQDSNCWGFNYFQNEYVKLNRAGMLNSTGKYTTPMWLGNGSSPYWWNGFGLNAPFWDASGLMYEIRNPATGYDNWMQWMLAFNTKAYDITRVDNQVWQWFMNHITEVLTSSGPMESGCTYIPQVCVALLNDGVAGFSLVVDGFHTAVGKIGYPIEDRANVSTTGTEYQGLLKRKFTHGFVIVNSTGYNGGGTSLSYSLPSIDQTKYTVVLTNSSYATGADLPTNITLAGGQGIIARLKSDYFSFTAVTPPTAPSSLTAVARLTSGVYYIDTTWHDNSSNETSQVVQLSANGGSTWITSYSVALNLTSYSINMGMYPTNQTYTIRVGASNSGGTVYSSNVSAVISGAPIQPPNIMPAPINLVSGGMLSGFAPYAMTTVPYKVTKPFDWAPGGTGNAIMCPISWTIPTGVTPSTNGSQGEQIQMRINSIQSGGGGQTLPTPLNPILEGVGVQVSIFNSPGDNISSSDYTNFLYDIKPQYCRCDFKWDAVGATSYSWSAIDTHVNNCVNNGIKIFACLAYGNASFGGYYSDTIITNTANRTAWLNYVTAVVNRYKDRVHVWEVWNEPNNSMFWSSTSAVNYTSLVAYTYNAIKAADSTAIVCAGGLDVSQSNYSTFFQTCVTNGILNKADVIVPHWYEGGQLAEGSTILGKQNTYRSIISTAGYTTPMGSSECGFSAGWDWGPWAGLTTAQRETQQAKYLIRGILAFKSRGQHFYNAYDLIQESVSDPYLGGFGMVLSNRSTKRPVYTAFKDLCAFLYSAQYVDTPINNVNGNYVLRFVQQPDQLKYAYWTTGTANNVTVDGHPFSLNDTVQYSSFTQTGGAHPATKWIGTWYDIKDRWTNPLRRGVGSNYDIFWTEFFNTNYAVPYEESTLRTPQTPWALSEFPYIPDPVLPSTAPYFVGGLQGSEPICSISLRVRYIDANGPSPWSNELTESINPYNLYGTPNPYPQEAPMTPGYLYFTSPPFKVNVPTTIALSSSTLTFSSPLPTLVVNNGVNLTPSRLTFSAPNPTFNIGNTLNLTPSTLTFSSPNLGITTTNVLALSTSTLTFSSPQPTFNIGNIVNLTSSILTFSAVNPLITTALTTPVTSGAFLEYIPSQALGVNTPPVYNSTVLKNLGTGGATYDLTLNNFNYTTSSGFNEYNGTGTGFNELVCDGINDQAASSSKPLDAHYDYGTLETWFILNASKVATTLFFDVGAGGGAFFALAMTATTVLECVISIWGRGDSVVVHQTPIALNTLYHVVATLNYRTFTLYLNGTPCTNPITTTNIAGNDYGDTRLGGGYGGQFANVKLFSSRLYKNTSLTQAQINANYAAGYNSTGSTTTTVNIALSPSILTFSSPQPNIPSVVNAYNLSTSTLTFSSPGFTVSNGNVALNLTSSILTFSSPSPSINAGCELNTDPSVWGSAYAIWGSDPTIWGGIPDNFIAFGAITFSSPPMVLEIFNSVDASSSSLTFSSPDFTVICGRTLTLSPSVLQMSSVTTSLEAGCEFTITPSTLTFSSPPGFIVDVPKPLTIDDLNALKHIIGDSGQQISRTQETNNDFATIASILDRILTHLGIT